MSSLCRKTIENNLIEVETSTLTLCLWVGIIERRKEEKFTKFLPQPCWREEIQKENSSNFPPIIFFPSNTTFQIIPTISFYFKIFSSFHKNLGSTQEFFFFFFFVSLLSLSRLLSSFLQQKTMDMFSMTQGRVFPIWD